MPASILVPQLIELAVQEIIQNLQMNLNANIDLVFTKYNDPTLGLDAAKINLAHVPLDRYYITDAVEPLILPTVFVIGDRTEHELGDAQNIAKQRHRVHVALLAYDYELPRLTRMAWRYATAMWLTLHDSEQGIGGMPPTGHVLAREVNYSPTYRSRGPAPDTGQRAFRKDITLTLDVHQYEAFQGYPR